VSYRRGRNVIPLPNFFLNVTGRALLEVNKNSNERTLSSL
jgi:hypothetical protein